MSDPEPPTDVETLAGRIELLEPSVGATRLVAIDGPAGAGKTELAAQLEGELDGVVVVHMDSLYPGWDGLEEGTRVIPGLLVPALADGRPASLPTWDWEAGTPGEGIEVEPAESVLVEGVGSWSSAAADAIGLLIWLDADPAERRRRAIARDGDAFAAHWDEWAAQESAHYGRERTADRADIRIRTDLTEG